MRFRVTAVFEYEVGDIESSYGTADPKEAANIDRAAMEDDPGVMLDLAGDWSLTVEPLVPALDEER